MKDWQKTLVHETTSIRETIRRIDESALQIALVVDEDKHLLGSVTDGDIRRGILKGIHLDSPVHQVMHRNPTTVQKEQSREQILATMKAHKFSQIPIVDETGVVCGLAVLDNLLEEPFKENWVILMAGGLGSRLQPLTDDCPKPLLKVGPKPLMETILENFRDQGFRRFYLAVNYKAEMIEDYFRDGSTWGVEIRYLKEQERLGTAGALSLITEPLEKPCLVMNGDILTRVDFRQMLDFHQEHEAVATMCVREVDFQVPYGVVDVQDHRIERLQEKPIYHYFANAGIYALNPEAVRQIPHRCYHDMTTLFDQLLAQRQETAVFPLREYWIDIGRMEDFVKANMEFYTTFA